MKKIFKHFFSSVIAIGFIVTGHGEAIAVTSTMEFQSTLTVVEQVNNDSGGTATYFDFPLFINGNPVTSGETQNVTEGVYTVTEINRPGYTVNFTGDCDANGNVTIVRNNFRNAVCTIINNDIGGPPAALIPPFIDVVKVPSPLALPAGPGLVTYTYTVKNIGMVPITGVTLLGDSCSPLTLVSGDTNNDTTLDINELWVYRCTATLMVTTRNTVVAIGYANGLTATHITNATVVVGAPGLPDTGVVPPLIHVTKIPSPLALPAGGGVVTFTITVTNPGEVALSNVGVTEDIINSSIHFVSGDKNGDSKLDPSETWVYTYQVHLDHTITNTIVATGLAHGIVATDFALATVVVPAGPGLPNTGLFFSHDLRLGVSDMDVKSLQRYLNTHGYALAVSGVGSKDRETSYFGRLTQLALIKFQKDNKIVPAMGYFGPITRAVMNK